MAEVENGKRKTGIHTDRAIHRKIKMNRRILSSSAKVELQNELNITISETKIRQRAHEVGLFDRVTRRKPYVNKVNRGKRLEYAQAYRENPLGFCNHAVWSNESKFNLFGLDGKVMVWRTTKEELDPQCTVPMVKYGGGSVKYWVCFSSTGIDNLVFIDGNMSGELYRDILQKNLLQSVKNLNMDKDWILQHDNDPKHRAAIMTNWLN